MHPPGEAIYNPLCVAETMTGQRGRTVKALPQEVSNDWRTDIQYNERA